jgi:hypothetical protein
MRKTKSAITNCIMCDHVIWRGPVRRYYCGSSRSRDNGKQVSRFKVCPHFRLMQIVFAGGIKIPPDKIRGTRQVRKI